MGIDSLKHTVCGAILLRNAMKRVGWSYLVKDCLRSIKETTVCCIQFITSTDVVDIKSLPFAPKLTKSQTF